MIAAFVAVADHQTRLTGLLQAETVVLSLAMLISRCDRGRQRIPAPHDRMDAAGHPPPPDRRRREARRRNAPRRVRRRADPDRDLVGRGRVDTGMRVGVPAATLIAGQLALGALTCAFGLACGLALRNLPAAVGTVLMIALVLPIVFQVKKSLNHVIQFLPYGELSAAAFALGSSPANAGSQLSALTAGVVLLAWTALIATIALTRLTTQTHDRDQPPSDHTRRRPLDAGC